MKRIFVLLFVVIFILSACSFSMDIGENEEQKSETTVFDDEEEVVETVEDADIDEVAEPSPSPSPSPDEPAMDETVVYPASKEDIKNALLDKNPEWDMDNVKITLSVSNEDFASGTVGFVGGGGGGYFYAANTEDGWVIAADGNGVIECSDIEPYDFPVDMIPECWDSEIMEPVQR
ncbi:hypothetical protein GF354_02755 [Candidatus Peregrinibacteria bacterium]|nr:hypothetical protein [Candidatus Peregrinibacteria bacterium]